MDTKVKFTALIVDDDEEIGEEISETIELIGGMPVYFANPVTCLEYLRRQCCAFEVVLVDLAMPSLNGLEFLELAHKQIASKPAKFILTGLSELGRQEISLPPDVTLLRKPVSTTEIWEKIGRPFASKR